MILSSYVDYFACCLKDNNLGRPVPSRPLAAPLWAALLACALLAGCSSRYDWREVSPPQAPMKMMLPAKPAEMTRQINLNGLEVDMQMHGARAGGQMFTAAWVRLPQAAREEVPAADRPVLALKAMQEGMLNNISATTSDMQERTISLISPGGDKIGLAPARFVEAEGVARDEPIHMQAVFVSLGDNLFQFVVMGSDWSDEAAKIFFESAQLQVFTPAAAE